MLFMTVSLIYNFKYTLNLAFLYIINQLVNYIDIFKKHVEQNKSAILVCFINVSATINYEPMLNIYKTLLFYTYWFILGILSTIGIGFGLQTGVLFVVPYIIDNYSEECNTNCNYTKLWEVYNNCLPSVIVWAIGSAVGELPPYFLAKNSQIDLSVIANNNRIINKLFQLLKNKLKQNSFITITIFACWPSVTFDMCGLLCGYYNLSLKQFLIPTIIGKAFIKTPILLFIIIYLYHNNNTLIENDNTKTFLSYIPLIIIFLFFKSFIEECAKKQIIEKKK